MRQTSPIINAKSRNKAWIAPTRKRVRQTVLEDIVTRVVRATQPDKVILFGSAALGTMHANSDVDLLIVKSGKFNRQQLVAKIYRALIGAEESVDAIVVTPEEIEAYRDSPCLVIGPALKQGRVVYGA